MLKKVVRAGIIFLVLFFSYQAAMANGVPNTLNYQGTLTNTAGQPLSGQYQIIFSLYETPTGGTALWTETQAVTITAGRFSATLGNITTLDPSILTGDTYIGVTVGADDEMIPRQKIASVAYALKSGDGIPAGVIVMWSGAADQVPEGWALCDGNNGTPDLRNRFVVGAGSGYAVGATGGNAAINLAHSHTVNDHTHTYSGSTGGPSDWNDNIAKGEGHTAADSGHHHNYSGTTSGASNRGTDTQLGSTSILPPYYALAFIMKLGLITPSPPLQQ